MTVEEMSSASPSVPLIRPKTPASECVKVVVRCRPLTEKEVRDGHVRIVEMDPERGAVDLLCPSKPTSGNEVPSTRKQFTFDAVYDWNSKQADLYDETARPLVDSVLEGFNGTIFAYGQTGTGKTYTMEGIKDDPDRRGVIPNSFDHIFSHIARSSNQQYLVRASYLEIYQENIRDLLLKDQSKRLELKERADVGVYVEGLTSFVCKSVGEIQHGMSVGNNNRAVGATNMNEHSSRSHAIFVITVEHSEVGIDGESHIRVGKLNLVDLAGSERQVKTGTSGQRQKEAIKINLSLSALGNVISALVDPKASHVPYRDSKLTRLLQDSLGGNSKTVMIANIGPASYNYEESLTTLRYANRAKNIKNKPRVNEDPKDALLREFQLEIERLKRLVDERNKKKGSKATDSDSGSQTGSAESVGHEALQKLTAKIDAMESKLLTGGKNIIDHTNEQERQLEKKREELAAQKRREREMLQKLEAKEENEMEVKETFSSLQQEIDIKKKKLKKLFSKLQSVKAEITDTCESNARERRELEDIQTDLLKELKLKLLIVDHFIPQDEKSNLISRITFDEEQDDWKFTIEINGSSGNDTFVRPINNSIRPVSSYSKIAASVGPAFRYKGEDIQDLDLIIPEKTVKDYSAPLVSPRVRAALDSVLATEESDMIVDAVEVAKASTQNEFRIIIDKKSGRPKTAMGGRSVSASRPKTSLRRETSEERRPETASLFGPSGRLRR